MPQTDRELGLKHITHAFEHGNLRRFRRTFRKSHPDFIHGGINDVACDTGLPISDRDQGRGSSTSGEDLRTELFQDGPIVDLARTVTAEIKHPQVSGCVLDDEIETLQREQGDIPLMHLHGFGP